jgi:hypothetical protein
MKSVIATTLLLGPLIAALPSPTVDRILPLNWKYTISSLRGPGCPDLGADPEVQRTTRLTYGQNTMDGSEIYYWFIAYPSLRVDLAGEKTSWCETELKYQEYKDLDQKVKADQYRLRLHKNGTKVIATYDLDAGVKATAKFTYEAGDDEVLSLLCYLFTPTEFSSADHRQIVVDRSRLVRPVCAGIRHARLCALGALQAAQVRLRHDQVPHRAFYSRGQG